MKDGVFWGAFEIYYDITEKKTKSGSVVHNFFYHCDCPGIIRSGHIGHECPEREKKVDGTEEGGRGTERLITELREALAEIKTLSGLLPICSSCKRSVTIRGIGIRLKIISPGIPRRSSPTHMPGMCEKALSGLLQREIDRYHRQVRTIEDQACRSGRGREERWF